jgi:nucleoid-associated protein YgaU
MARTTSEVDTFIEKIKENYVSALIGLVIFVLGLGFVANSLSKQKQPASLNIFGGSDSQQEETKDTEPDAPTSYIVKKGDTLWSIAEAKIGSGYNYVDLAKANKLTNANLIEVGQKLTIPQEVKVIKPEQTMKKEQPAATAKITIKEGTYTVKKGDNLWNIAVGAYGDGFAWTKISSANKLMNPSIIEPGQKLTIPRK